MDQEKRSGYDVSQRTRIASQRPGVVPLSQTVLPHAYLFSRPPLLAFGPDW